MRGNHTVWSEGRPLFEPLEPRVLLSVESLAAISSVGVPLGGEQAIQLLGVGIAEVAQRYGVDADVLTARLRSDPTLYVDSGGALFYADPPPTQDGSVEGGSEEPAASMAQTAPYPYSDTFRLHSRPGASKVIYLDFDGHTTPAGTLWNSGNAITSAPFDTDDNPSNFSNAEQDKIQGIWQRVSEDYSPFDIDVTTEDPGDANLTRSNSGDQYYGFRCVISPSNAWLGGSWGGMSYIGAFADVGDNRKPNFVFSNMWSNNEKYIAESISHEVGHAIGLWHDDATGGSGYYPGHGSGITSWSTIMGKGNYKNVVQWSKGEYFNATNTEDDLSIITTQNGFDYRPDDHGNTLANATALTVTGGANVTSHGVVERNSDVDMFSFATAAGTVSLSIQPFALAPDLDILAKIYDSGGAEIATSNREDALAASFSLPLAAGTYYLSVEGTGYGTPLNDPPTGYTKYGSIGQYWVSGTIGQIANHVPVLSNPRVTPGAGTTNTDFFYRVAYSDGDGDPPIVADVFVDGIGHAMSLESGQATNGTYVYQTRLSAGATHNYFFSFRDASNPLVNTPITNGPGVGWAESTSAVTFYSPGYGGVPFTDDIEIRYSLNGGPTLRIPGSRLAVPGVTELFTAPATLHLEAWCYSANHQFGEWEIRQNGQIIPDGATPSVTVDVNLNAGDLGVASFWRYAPQYYDLGGTVAKSGTPIQGAVISLTGPGVDQEVVTGSSGTYSFSHLAGGVPYAISAEHVDYAFAPPSFNIPNLTGSSTAYSFNGTSADGVAPTVSLTQTPSKYVDDRSHVAFSWLGSDNKTPTSSLLYQYQLLGSGNESWSAWGAGTSVSYDLSNGVYTFKVKAKDAAGNETVVPAKHTFAVSAVPRISQAGSLADGIWLGEFEVTALPDATGISDKVVILPEQFGLMGEDFVPIRLYPKGSRTPIGTIDYATQELGLPGVFKKTDVGFTLTLPAPLAAGQSAEFAVQWGKIAHLGWQDNVSVPMAGPNMEVFQGQYLDQNLLLWRLGSKWDNKGTHSDMDNNAYLYVQVSDANGSVVNERLLDFVPANYYTVPRPGDPSNPYYYGTRGQFSATRPSFIETPTEVWAFWQLEKYTWNEAQQEIRDRTFGFQRFNKNTLELIGQPVYSTFTNGHMFYPTLSPNGDVWLLGEADGRLVYSRVGPTGSILAYQNTVATLSDSKKWGSYWPIVTPDGKVWYFYERRWYTQPGETRRELYLKILNPDGTTFRDEARISPAASGPEFLHQDQLYSGTPIVDKDGKVWVSFTRCLWEDTIHYYSIFNPDGSSFKDQVQTTARRNFNFVDSNGLIWATGDNQVQILNPDDTAAEPARPGTTLVPNQSVGSRGAIVNPDSYRLFDRWSTRAVDVKVLSQTSVGPMQLVNSDQFGQQALVADLDISTISGPVSHIQGVLPSYFEIDASQFLTLGDHVFNFLQTGLLGGELVVSFGLPLPTLSINDVTFAEGNNGRRVSAIEPSGIGVQTIEVTFSEPVNFGGGAVTIQTFPAGATLIPVSTGGTGTNKMTITFDLASVVDTWLKVRLNSGAVTDLAGNALDGEAPAAGSGRGYIYSAALDLPTGDGLPGGDAVFYVGSLRGDFNGDLAITAADKDGFAAAWRSGSLDADFRGVGFGPRPPDGRITLADINGFTSVYQAGIALGRHLDPLPMSGGGLASEVTPLPPLTAPSAGTDILTEAAGLLPLSQQTAPPVTGPQDTHLVQGDEEPLDLLRLRRLRPVAVIQSAGAVVLRL